MPHSSSPFPPSGWVDPEAAFAHLYADAPHAFWLDAGVDADSGWSWIGEGRPDASAPPMRRDATTPTVAHEAGPFRGGWVGWRTYEGETAFLRVERFLAFDHAHRRVFAFGDPELLTRALDAPPAPAVAEPERRGTASARVTPERYAELIAACREAIREGDAYQLCLTTRFTVPGAVDALEVFRRLRRASSSHHAGFIRAGERAWPAPRPSASSRCATVASTRTRSKAHGRGRPTRSSTPPSQKSCGRMPRSAPRTS